MSKEYKLHCFAQSGSAYKVALMLACSGVDWEPVFVDFFHGQTRGADWRASTNEMGEVPVLEHAGNTLTQSGVILDYLADRLGTFAAQNENEKREILRWILFDNHKFTSYIASYRYFRSFATTPQLSPSTFAIGRKLEHRPGVICASQNRHAVEVSRSIHDEISGRCRPVTISTKAPKHFFRACEGGGY